MSSIEIKNITNNLQSTSDDLHGAIDQAALLHSNANTSMAAADHFQDIVKHPNSTADHVTKILSLPGINPETEYDHDDLVSEAAKSGKMTAPLAEKFLSDYKGQRQNYIQHLAAVPGVSKDFLKGLVHKAAENADFRYIPDYHTGLTAADMHEIYDTREIPDPEQTLTETQIPRFNRSKKLDKWFYDNIGKVSSSPEDNKRSVKLIINPPPNLLSDRDEDERVSQFVDKNDTLDHSDIETLYSHAQGMESNYSSIRDIIQHKNMPPALISRDLRGGSEDMKSLLAGYAKLSDDDVRAVIATGDKDSLRTMSGNGNLQPQQKTELYSHFKNTQGDTDNSWAIKNIVRSQDCPEEIINDFWESSPKDSEHANFMLDDVSNLPKPILTDIITKNKNILLSARAITHKNVDKEVLDLAMKRKASAVQEAAMSHPLMIKEHLHDRIKSGAIDLGRVFTDTNIRKAYGGYVDDATCKVVLDKINETDPKDHPQEALRSLTNIATGGTSDPTPDTQKAALDSVIKSAQAKNTDAIDSLGDIGSHRDASPEIAEAAQMAYLQNGGKRFGEFFDKEKSKPKVINHIFNNAEHLAVSDNPNAKKEEIKHIKNKAAQTGKLDMPTFMNFIKSGEMDFLTGNSQYVFSNQFGKLDSEEKLNAYNAVIEYYKNPTPEGSIQNNHGQALYALAKDSGTPPEILDRAYNEAKDTDDKSIFAEDFNPRNSPPQNMIKDLITGQLGSSRKLNTLRNSLRIDEENTANAYLNHFMDDNLFPEGDASPEVSEMPSFGRNYDIKNHNAQRFFKTILNKSNNYDDLTGYAANAISERMDKGRAAPEDMAAIRSILESNPNIDKQKALFSKVIGNTSAADNKGSLDWIAGSPADHDGELTKSLIRRNLLSQAKMDEIAQANPMAHLEALENMPWNSSNSIVHNLYATQAPNLDIAKKINDTLPYKAIVSTKGLDPSEVFTTKNKNWQSQADQLKAHVNYQLLSGNLEGVDAIDGLIKAGVLNTKHKKIAKDVIQQVYDNINTLPIDSASVDAAKTRLTQSLLGSECLPEPMFNEHVNRLVNTGDIGTLINTADALQGYTSEKTPANLAKAIGSFADRIQTLRPNDQIKLLDWVSRGNAPLTQTKKIHKVLLSNVTTPEQKESINKVLLSSAESMIRAADTEEKAGYAVDLATKIIRDPQISQDNKNLANSALAQAVQGSNKISDKHKIQAFVHMNAEYNELNGLYPFNNSEIPDSVIQSDEAFAAATHGTKLLAMATFGMSKLNEDKVSALLDRIQANPDVIIGDSAGLITSLLRNKNTISEAVAQKAMNTIGHSYSIAQRGSEIDFGKRSTLGDIIIRDDIQELKSGIADSNMSLNYKSQHISERLGRYSSKAYPEYHEALLDSQHNVIKSMIAQAEIGSDQVTANNVQQLTDRLIKNNKEFSNDEGASSLKMLEIAQDFSNLKDTLKTKFPNSFDEIDIIESTVKMRGSFFQNMDPNTDINKIYQFCPNAYDYYDDMPKLTSAMLDKVPTDDPSISDSLHHWPQKMDSNTFTNNFMPKVRELIVNPRFAQDEKGLKKLITSISKYHPDSLTDDDVTLLSTYGKTQGQSEEEQVESAARSIELMGGKNITLPFIQKNLEKSKEVLKWSGTKWPQEITSFIKRTHHINDIADQLMKINPKAAPAVIIENDAIDTNTIGKVVFTAKDSEYEHHITNTAMKKPNISEGLLSSLVDRTKQGFSFFDKGVWMDGTSIHPAFYNPTYGHDLFIKESTGFPKNGDITLKPQDNNLVHTAEHSKEKNAIREALTKVPPEGISYQDYKKINPKNAETAAVKSIFMAAKGQKATPEDLAKGMKEHGGDFHITYSSWGGAQRHTKKDNLVMQLNTGKDMNEAMKKDPKLHGLFQLMQKTLVTHNDRTSNHPVTPFNASWVRIDTSAGQDGWIIEETQSDFDAHLDVACNRIAERNPSGLTINGETIKPEELPEYKKKIAKIISGWHEASIKATIELAKKNGIKNLYMHGIGVRSYLSGMGDKKEYPVWMQHMYERWPRNNGLEEVDYQDYPNKSQSTYDNVKSAGRSTKCWKFKL